MYLSKGISEEVAKSLDVSLSQIDTCRLDGESTLILGQKKYSNGGGVTERLAGKLKKMFTFVYYIVLSTAD